MHPTKTDRSVTYICANAEGKNNPNTTTCSGWPSRMPSALHPQRQDGVHIGENQGGEQPTYIKILWSVVPAAYCLVLRGHTERKWPSQQG